MMPDAGGHHCWLRPRSEEQPDGGTPCPKDSLVCFKRHVKTWHLGSQPGKHSNRDSKVGVFGQRRGR